MLYLYENDEFNQYSHLKQLFTHLQTSEWERIDIEVKIAIFYFLCDELVATDIFRSEVDKIMDQFDELTQKKRDLGRLDSRSFFFFDRFLNFYGSK